MGVCAQGGGAGVLVGLRACVHGWDEGMDMAGVGKGVNYGWGR